MRRLIRAPLLWMVLAEIAVVGALILLAWHAIAGASGSGAPTTTGISRFPWRNACAVSARRWS